MSNSSGSIVGGSGVPTGKIILNSSSSASTYTFTICLNTSVNGSETLHYYTMIPEKVGCDINIAQLLNITPDIKVLGLQSNGQWDIITSASATFVPLSQKIGCFNRGTLDIEFENSDVYCDLIVCITGTFVLPSCKVVKQCENYCIYISKRNVEVPPPPIILLSETFDDDISFWSNIIGNVLYTTDDHTANNGGATRAYTTSTGFPFPLFALTKFGLSITNASTLSFWIKGKSGDIVGLRINGTINLNYEIQVDEVWEKVEYNFQPTDFPLTTFGVGSIVFTQPLSIDDIQITL